AELHESLASIRGETTRFSSVASPRPYLSVRRVESSAAATRETDSHTDFSDSQPDGENGACDSTVANNTVGKSPNVAFFPRLQPGGVCLGGTAAGVGKQSSNHLSPWRVSPDPPHAPLLLHFLSLAVKPMFANETRALPHASGE
ncbi:hypothetical protein KUCAC02_012193, partial [Chaenocephalus aceratus]